MGIENRIFELVDKKFKSDKEFAAALGVKPQRISEWRNATSKSYNKYLSQIAGLLGTSVEYLLAGTDRTDSCNNFLPPEDVHILRQIHDRPGLRMMFDLNVKATDADIERAVEILKAYYGIKEGQQ